MRPHNKLIIPASLLALALHGCSAPDAPRAAPATPAESSANEGHGTLVGASEEAEPQLHLLTVNPAGSVDMLELATESWKAAGSVRDVSSIATDGRYVFASSADKGTVTVVDSGVWTWDHEDHFHYYSSEPRTLGTVPGEGEAVVSPGSSGTGVYFPATGRGVVLDNEGLADGEVRQRTELAGEPHEGMLVPLAKFALATVPGPGGTTAGVRAYDVDGSPLDGSEAECADARGTITTPVGAVIGCADGALLATAGEASVTFERIPYPAGTTAARATDFRAREGRPTVAAVAGTEGAWLLDTRERTWQLLQTDVPLLQVSAVDDRDGHVVALSADGRVLVLSAETGATLSATGPLLPETLSASELPAGVELIVDQHRAYLNAPAERQLHEIDFADKARLARSFEVTSNPRFLAETGR